MGIYDLRKVLVVALFIAASILQPVYVGHADTDVKNILKKVQDKYAHLKGCQIPYTREVITRSMSMLGSRIKRDRATGDMFFAPPYFMRLEQRTPRRETIVGDGKTIWWYVHDESSVYRYPADKFGKELRLLSDIFSGLATVEERFRVSLVHDDSCQGKSKKGRDLPDKRRSAVSKDTKDTRGEACPGHGCFVIRLVPLTPWEEIDHINLSVDKDYDIREVSIFNVVGGVTRFILCDVIVRSDLSRDFFRFVPPKGVKVITDQN